MGQMVRTMHANGLRLLKLINNLLDLAKIESRELQVRRLRLDPARLVRDVVEGARGLAERKGVRLECGALEAVEGFHGDPDALDKVLVNLVGNALKFTEPGGRIELSVRREAGGMHLAVVDTGVGIPADQLERIFDRFAQVDDSATRRHEGTGIGLSLVRELVELHGGKVWAESAGLGQGSTLHVQLPLGEADAETEEALLEGGAHGEALGRSIAAMEAELSHHGELGPDRLVELERNVERFEDTPLGRGGRGPRSPADDPRGAGRRGQRRDAPAPRAPARTPLPGALGAERAAGARGGAREAPRRGGDRRDDAGAVGHRAVPRAEGRPGDATHPRGARHLEGRARDEDRGPRARCGRLRHEALPPARAAGPRQLAGAHRAAPGGPRRAQRGPRAHQRRARAHPRGAEGGGGAARAGRAPQRRRRASRRASPTRSTTR